MTILVVPPEAALPLNEKFPFVAGALKSSVNGIAFLLSITGCVIGHFSTDLR
jgi:hypothetical protein